ncbi:MAG TPA: endonuclease/exonuclease/phosphatase family protein [Pyrinomonadaceae bacterium]
MASQVTVRKLARHLVHQPPSAFTLRGLLGAKKGKLSLSAEKVRFSLMTQNMGLLTWPGVYLGTDRPGAVKELVARINALSPDVVGLCEVFADDEIAQIKVGILFTHPYRSYKLAESSVFSDGGCWVFSKHKILKENHHVFANYVGDDKYADKGVVHIRIQPPGALRPLEIFYSHNQNIEEVGGKNALYAQLVEMAGFIKKVADPNNPIFIMGDLNVPGEVPKHYEQMIIRLLGPVDFWLVSGGDPAKGFTFVADNNFYANPAKNPKLNRRVDYILMRAPKTFVPMLKSIDILKFKLGGRDLSDHFGLHAQFEQAAKVTF